MQLLIADSGIIRDLLILPVVIMFLMIMLMYLKYRKRQPHFLIPQLPDPVPKRDFTELEDDERKFAAEFWEYMDAVAYDFEKTGHPLQYRQFIDLLRYAPSADLKIFSAQVLTNSKHLQLYANDAELRSEILQIIEEKALESDEISEAYFKLLLKLPTTQSEKEDIAEFIDKNLADASEKQKQMLNNLKNNLANKTEQSGE